MSKTIAQLYNGNLEPIRYLGQNDPEIKQLESLIQRNGEKLEESLGEGAKEILEKYTGCINEYIGLLNEQAFQNGFCLGTRLVVEALLCGEKCG